MNALSNAIAKLLVSMLIAFAPVPAAAQGVQGLTQGSYHWYAPEHEKYGRTEFYSQPTFQSSMVRVIRTQRFKIVSASRGWAMIEFDVAGKAFVHLRVLRNIVYDPAATDVWHEFQRASVFPEEPAKIEARLKAPALATPNADPKTPSWKRYKDAWGLKPARPAMEDAAATDGSQPASRPVPGTAKPRSKYPLLTPIGAEPQQEPPPPDSPESAAETTPPR